MLLTALPGVTLGTRSRVVATVASFKADGDGVGARALRGWLTGDTTVTLLRWVAPAPGRDWGLLVYSVGSSWQEVPLGTVRNSWTGAHGRGSLLTDMLVEWAGFEVPGGQRKGGRERERDPFHPQSHGTEDETNDSWTFIRRNNSRTTDRTRSHRWSK